MGNFEIEIDKNPDGKIYVDVSCPDASYKIANPSFLKTVVQGEYEGEQVSVNRYELNVETGGSLASLHYTINDQLTHPSTDNHLQFKVVEGGEGKRTSGIILGHDSTGG